MLAADRGMGDKIEVGPPHPGPQTYLDVVTGGLASARTRLRTASRIASNASAACASAPSSTLTKDRQPGDCQPCVDGDLPRKPRDIDRTKSAKPNDVWYADYGPMKESIRHHKGYRGRVRR
ncbi:unnamed protein product [Vitrella brassicaformis CCMP3155]|uniref:Uncharacterized protein n=1 Tax=Vitrella brassicaformis (strain CCMP3155) TaxID=1169540 RepID=A0A0G4ELH2_VITBC|nr:unnamed protein product [Vitrella brassicaformis CCMP3155]|eukprot:CEL98263.1 unnamed protein product [Vitrella brassicaformis CCMP3155]